ncbi:hypothetical protein E3N88_26310 [Mikania micrantha]|uniref:Uncharacterized protein n=1 Tax=Mikania micrantha TaxID=192012 RepID=A0A5N6N9W3_9ASTR|nr:hypothetical protein E3N88_26310 [Mikania micrantha]
MDAGEVPKKMIGSEQNTNSKVLETVGNVIVSINEARHVDQVICARYSFDVRIFPLDYHAFAAMDAGEVPEKMIGSEQNTNSKVLETVGNVIVSINETRHVDQVICALYSFVVRIFPLDYHAFAGHLSLSFTLII